MYPEGLLYCTQVVPPYVNVWYLKVSGDVKANCIVHPPGARKHKVERVHGRSTITSPIFIFLYFFVENEAMEALGTAINM